MSGYREALSIALKGAPRETYLASLQAYLDANLILRFKAYEVCNVGRRTYDKKRRVWVHLQPAPIELWANILPTLRVAEWLRNQYGLPVDVNSGWRDPDYNRAVGGAAKSLHAAFCAMDVSVRGIAPSAVAKKLEAFPDAAKMGIGVYRTFVHIDTRGYLRRPAPARWSA